jgi:hypothetical protein
VTRLGLRLALPLLLLANGCLFAAANTGVRTYSPSYYPPVSLPCLADSPAHSLTYLLTDLLTTPRPVACSVRASR